MIYANRLVAFEQPILHLQSQSRQSQIVIQFCTFQIVRSCLNRFTNRCQRTQKPNQFIVFVPQLVGHSMY